MVHVLLLLLFQEVEAAVLHSHVKVSFDIVIVEPEVELFVPDVHEEGLYEVFRLLVALKEPISVHAKHFVILYEERIECGQITIL